MTGLFPGDHFAVAHHPLFADELYDDHPCVGGCDPLDGDPISVQVNTTTSGVDFVVGRLGSISGRLTEAVTGVPLDGDWVEVFDWTGAWVEGASADGSGDYLVGGLGAGTYFVRTSTWHHADELYDDLPCEPECTVTAGTPVAVADGSATSGIDFALVPLGRLAGRVTEEGTGAPIPDVWVSAHDNFGNYRGGTNAGGDGTYLVPDLAAGIYFVRTEGYHYANELYDDLPCTFGCEVTDGTPVGVVHGSITGGVDFALVRLGGVSGTVTDASTGLPIEGVQVMVATSEGWQGSSTTDGSGAYSVEPLLPGTHFVATNGNGPYLDELYQEIQCPGGPVTGCDPTTGTPVTVSLATTTPGVDFTLELGGALSGSVTAAAGGIPLAGVEVLILDGAGVELEHVWSAGDGSWEVVGLPASTYFVMAREDGFGTVVFDGVLCPEWPGPGCDPTTGTPIAVNVGVTTSGIDFALERLGGFSGVVVNALTGNPVDGAGVRVYASDGSSGPHARPDGLGLYRVEELYPGAYFAVGDGSWLAPEVYDNHPCPGGICDPTAGTPIAVTFDYTTPHVDFALDPNGEISGVVTDEITGTPLQDGRVEVWGPTGLQLASSYLGHFGDFHVWNLPPGPVFVTTDTSSAYLDELYDDLPCLWGPPVGCDPTKGTPVIVPSGGVAAGVDFALRFRESGVSGLVVSSETGEPVAGVRIDVWRRSDHGLVRSTTTSATGVYLVSLSSSEYVISTDNGLGLVDEVYDDHWCLQGSALAGSCDLGQGDPVMVTSGELTTGVDFVLRRATLFNDGFESGTVAAWSSVVP